MGSNLVVIGNRLKFLREEKGWTQEELATKLQLSRSAWKAKEDGRGDLKTGLILELSAIFDVSTDYLLTGSDEKRNAKQAGEEFSKILRRKVCQQINREAHRSSVIRSPFSQGYIAALSRVVHLIDKMKNADTDDYDEHKYSGLLEEE